MFLFLKRNQGLFFFYKILEDPNKSLTYKVILAELNAKNHEIRIVIPKIIEVIKNDKANIFFKEHSNMLSIAELKPQLNLQSIRGVYWSRQAKEWTACWVYIITGYNVRNTYFIPKLGFKSTRDLVIHARQTQRENAHTRHWETVFRKLLPGN